jgi:hypothetical protein
MVDLAPKHTRRGRCWSPSIAPKAHDLSLDRLTPKKVFLRKHPKWKRKTLHLRTNPVVRRCRTTSGKRENVPKMLKTRKNLSRGGSFQTIWKNPQFSQIEKKKKNTHKNPSLGNSDSTATASRFQIWDEQQTSTRNPKKVKPWKSTTYLQNATWRRAGAETDRIQRCMPVSQLPARGKRWLRGCAKRVRGLWAGIRCRRGRPSRTSRT